VGMGRGPSVGEVIPDFVLPEAFGGTVRLSDLLRQGHALLAFYPSDFGVMCSVEMRALQGKLPQFHERGTTVVGISTNSVVTHSAWKEHMGFTIPRLSDYDGKVSDSLGVFVVEAPEQEYMLGRCLRAVAIVDHRHILRFFWVTEDHASEPDYDLLLDACSLLD
jgi:peroxiredoxin